MKRRLFLWLFYLAILLCIALPHGMRTQLTPLLDCPELGEVQNTLCKPEALFATATNADVIRAFQTADAAFMAKKVRDGERSAWPLWPPGMMLIQSFFYWLSPNLPIALILVLLASALWAGVLAQLAMALRKPAGRYAALVLPLLLLLSPEFKYLLGMGVFYTESLSISAFLLGIGLLCQACTARRMRMAVFAGLCFAFSAYMRAQSDLVMSVTLILMLLFLSLKTWLRHKSLKPMPRIVCASRWLGVFALSLLAYHVATLPWRATHHMQWIGFSESPIWHATWERANDLPPGLQFYTTGGGLAGCTVDPALCENIHAQVKQGHHFIPKQYLEFSLKTFLHHPLRWLAFKLPYLRHFWFENAAEGAVLAIALPLTLLTCLSRRTPAHRILALFLCGTAIGITGPLLLTHIEPRYLYQCKLTILYGTILALGLSIRPAHNEVS